MTSFVVVVVVIVVVVVVEGMTKQKKTFFNSKSLQVSERKFRRVSVKFCIQVFRYTIIIYSTLGNIKISL